MSRTFGVEIECGHPEDYDDVHALLLAGGCSREWSVGYDGSGVEARTPILKGPSGFKEFKKGMNIIRSTGGYVTHRDGMHVHHGTPELENNKALAVRLVKSWAVNQEVLNLFVNDHRKSGGGPCPPWHASHIAALERAVERPEDATQGIYDSYSGSYRGRRAWFGRCGPRGALNLRSLENHGTVELRLFEGTLDYDIAEAWVKFGQRFIDNVLKQRKRALSKASEPSELLKRVKLNKTASDRLLAKASGSYRDLTFQSF